LIVTASFLAQELCRDDLKKLMPASSTNRMLELGYGGEDKEGRPFSWIYIDVLGLTEWLARNDLARQVAALKCAHSRAAKRQKNFSLARKRQVKLSEGVQARNGRQIRLVLLSPFQGWQS